MAVLDPADHNYVADGEDDGELGRRGQGRPDREDPLDSHWVNGLIRERHEAVAGAAFNRSNHLIDVQTAHWETLADALTGRSRYTHVTR